MLFVKLGLIQSRLARKGQTMSDLLTILGAPLISAGAAILVSVIQNYKTMTVIQCKIEDLTKKVEKHNSVIDRVYKLEKEEAVMEEEIKVVNHRIEDLEQYHK